MTTLALLMLAGTMAEPTCVTIAYTSTPSWRFVAERIDMTIEPGAFVIDARYEFEGAARPMDITYPFPADLTLGEPTLLAATIEGEGVNGSPILSVGVSDGSWTWTMPPAEGTVEVGIRYRQSMWGGRATYVLRSAAGWPEPIRSAELILRVRSGTLVNVVPELAFQQEDSTHRARFESWVPETDFVVEVEPTEAARFAASWTPPRP